MSQRVHAPASTSWRPRLSRPGICATLAILLVLALPLSGLGSPRAILRCAWFTWVPYQYVQKRQDIEFLTGLDVQLTRGVLNEAGYGVSYQPVRWREHLSGLENGTLDIATGATLTPERQAYAYFSAPYRAETNVLYVRSEDRTRYHFKTVQELLRAVTEGTFRLGVVDGAACALPEVRQVVADPRYRSRVIPSADDPASFQELVGRAVDGVICDRVVGVHIVFSLGLHDRVVQCPVDLGSTPIHVMFSKKTCTEADVQSFNRSLAAFTSSGRTRETVRAYLMPFLVSQTMNTPWFFILDLIGTAAFAVSGILLARKERYNIVGALLLAALPAVGGGLMRDLITGRHPVGIMRSPVYFLIVLLVVLAGYFVFFLTDRWRQRSGSSPDEGTRSGRLARHLFDVCDTVGLATFTVIGVGVALETHSEPLWLWSALLAAMTAAGGSILRDIVRADGFHPALKSSIYAEIPLVWGLLLALFLDWECERLSPPEIRMSVLVTVTGAFLSRLFVIYAPVSRFLLYAPHAYDPAVKLLSIRKTEAELVELLPSYTAGLVADGPASATGELEVERVHALARKAHLRIMEDVSALVSERLGPPVLDQLMAAQRRTSFLSVLTNDVYELVVERSLAQESERLAELNDSLLNALHTVLAQTAEVVRSESHAGIDMLIAMTDDRSVIMDRIRQGFQDREAPVSPKEARHLWRLTTLFERVVWVLQQYAVLVRQGRSPLATEA